MRRLGIRSVVALSTLLLASLCSAQQIPDDRHSNSESGNPPEPVLGWDATPNFIPIWRINSCLPTSVVYQASGGKAGTDTKTPVARQGVNGDLNTATTYQLARSTLLSIGIPRNDYFLVGPTGNTQSSNFASAVQDGRLSVGSGPDICGFCPCPPPSNCNPPGLGAPGSNNRQGTVAEPVSTGNGNYFYQHADFSIPGRGLQLVFQRSYNSQDNSSGPLGANWTHSYNVLLTSNSNGAIIKWADGHYDVYTLNGSVYVPPPGVFNSLVKNSDGTFTLVQKNQTQYNFSTSGILSGIVDKNGNQLSFTYDQNNNLTQITDTVGRHLNLIYDSSNRITQIADPISRTESFTYSSNNDLATVTDPLGNVTTYAYDASHHVTTVTLPGGSILLTNTYDTNNPARVVTQTNGNNFTTIFAYNTPNSGQTTITDPLGNTRIDTYDNYLRLVQVTDAIGGTISYSYDGNNDQTSTTDQNGNTTNFTYDANGNTLTVADALGNVKTYTYDSKNDLLSSITPRRYTTTFTYDATGNLLTTRDALGDTTTFAYDNFGELTSKTDADGNITAYSYDSFGNVVRVTDALNHTTTLGYDGISRLTSVTDPNGHTSTSSYDALSRLITITDPLGDTTQFQYSPLGNLTQVTDANGHATSYAYDAANNLIHVTDAARNVTTYGYGANNNRASFVNAKGKTTAYSYDQLNRLSRVTDPLQFATLYSYDGVGNVKSVTDPDGHTNSFSYDADNRLTLTSYFDGTHVARTYDADGNRVTMVDPSGTTTYAYDALDRMISVNAPSGTVSYAYDPIGKRATVTYPDTKQVHYGYNPVNRLLTTTDWLGHATTYSYDPANNLTAIAYPNRANISLSYDSANRLRNVTNTYQGSGIGNDLPYTSFAYILDRVGNRLQLTDGSGAVTRYVYDPLYELTAVESPTGTTIYTYDAVGNRLSLRGATFPTIYTYDADDRLLAAGHTTFTYDNNGNRLTKSAGLRLQYSYDAADRLVSLSGTLAAAFAYDGDGNRISQRIGTHTYVYVNDTASTIPVVLEESGADGSIAYAYGIGLISESATGFDYFYHHEGLGSVIGLTDASGTIQQGYGYDPWGNSTASVGSGGTRNKFRFAGEALDPGTGLYYLRARYHDSTVGRFITRDSLPAIASLPLSANRFTYVDNNPVNLTDPSGYTPTPSSPLCYQSPFPLSGLLPILDADPGELLALIIGEDLLVGFGTPNLDFGAFGPPYFHPQDRFGIPNPRVTCVSEQVF